MSLELDIYIYIYIDIKTHGLLYVANEITVIKIIKIRLPPSRDAIIIPVLVVASVTL